MAINFNVAPYYDDYADEDGYLRVLFRPGYAIQARELTQLQTILQKQVSRFGDHVFKNGSMVVPGGVNVDNLVHFAKLDTLFDNQSVSSYIDSFRNKIITGVESGVKALVIDTSNCECMVPEDGDTPTLYFKIEQTGGDGETKRFIPGESIVAYEDDNSTTTNYRLTEDQVGDIYVNVRSFGDGGVPATSYTKNPVSDVLGYSYAVEVEQGVYYIDGFFVQNEELHLYVGRFQQNPTCRVGFKVEEQIITPEEEPALSDNAQGTTNYAAPGAHRYKINLSLVRLPLDSTDDIKFIELVRIVDGRIQSKLEKSSYAELEKTLARRTFDESGNYEVNKFKLTTREHLNYDGGGVYPPVPTDSALIDGQTYGDIDKFVVAVSPGKAYVQGFEIESTATQFIPIDKARENSVTGDEGGHIIREDDYPIQTPIGNYVIVDNVFNFPESTFPTVNLYSVSRKPPNGTTITDGVAPDSTTKVGTARVKSFQLHSGTYNGDASQFKLALFDVQMSTNNTTGLKYVFSDTVKSVALDSNDSNIFTADIVTTELGIIGSADVSNASDSVTGIGTLFQDQVSVGDVLYIDGNKVGVVASIESNVALTLENAADDTYSGIVGVARAIIEDQRYESLIFKSEFKPLKTLRGVDANGNDTVDSSVLTVRRQITNTSDSQGGLWSYQLTSSFEAFQSTQDLSNYTLFYTHPLTGSRRFVEITSSQLSLSTNNREITITNPNIIASQEYTLLASVEQRKATAKERIKTLNTDEQYTITSKKSVTEKTILLPHADVLRIKDIRVNPGNFDSYVELNSVSVLNKYSFDNGQRSTHYQKASISLLPNVSPPSGAIKVIYDYFSYSGNGNYFSVDSYTATIDDDTNDFTYSDIPSFSVRGSDGVTETLYLHDVIDFRPVVEGLNTFTPDIPKVGSSFSTSIAYYLPRFDKISLDSIGRFVVTKGIPDLDPKEPKDPTEGMVMATIYVPAYTKNVSDIRVFQRDNKRYTMKEIGNLEKRIQNLEYYVSLTLLEQETASLQIKDAQTGLDRFKNGFIVDQFTGHGVGDVQNIDYRIAVDSERNELRPMHFTDALDIVEDVNSSDERLATNYKKSGDIITLPYTENLYMFNPNGTRTIDVNPYKIGAFKGEIVLNPEGDNWKDTDRRPDLQVTDDNNFDAIKFLADELGVTGTVWNEWQTTWTGSSTTTRTWQTGDPTRRRQIVTGYQQTTRVDTGVQSRTGIRTSVQSSVNTEDYGDRVVDVSFAPYMRARPVTFVAKNLKANTRYYSFFDKQAVSSYVTPADVFKVTRAAGTTFMTFDPAELSDRVIVGDTERTVEGAAEPAFQIGEVLRQGVHTPCTIQSIANITADAGAGNFTVTVDTVANLAVGHQVRLYNMAPVRVVPAVRTRRPNGSYQTQASMTVPLGSTSRQLNNRRFVITAINGTTLTLANINGGVIGKFDAYSRTGAYAGSDGAKLVRVRASAVVAFAGVVDDEDSNGPVVQDVHVVNIKGGFAIGETLVGKIVFNNAARNTVTLTAINGNSTVGTLPVYKQIGDAVRSDTWGSCVGVFNIPNDDTLRFRTGEREFKLTDNISNSDADFDSKGTVLYYSQGVTLSKERTIVNSRQANFVQDRLYESIPVRRVSTSTRQLYSYYTGHDPVAQTFTVQSEGGVFITGVDLYFSEAGNRPTTVEFRNTNNGVPSSKIMPFTTVTKTPQQINVSDDGSVATRFTFASPVYLLDNETYALVVKTDEPGAQVWVSEVGQTDILTGNIVTSQPLTGSLYLSQNSKEFEINPLLDMKFRMYAAEFDTTQIATVNLKAEHARNINLPANPFQISQGTDIVRVRAPRHGFQAGDYAYISGVEEFLDPDTQELKRYGTASSEYGIPASLLTGPVQVIAEGLDIDYFCFVLDTTDDFIDPDTGLSRPIRLISNAAGTENEYNSLTSSYTVTVQQILDEFVNGNYGGTGVICSRQLLLDTLFLKSDSVVPTGTRLEWSVQATNEDNSTTGYKNISENTNFSFGTRKVIRSYENEAIISAASGVVRPSLSIRAKLYSDNKNVSPVLDLAKLSSYVVRNLVDNPTEELVNINGVDDTTLLAEGSVTAADIGTQNGTGTVVSYYLTNVFGTDVTLSEFTSSGSDWSITNSDPSAYNWLGTGTSQTSTPWKYLSVGDELYSTSATEALESAEKYGRVKSINASTLVLENSNKQVTAGNFPQFKVLSKVIRGVGTDFSREIPAGSAVNGANGTFVGIVNSVQSATKATLLSFAEYANIDGSGVGLSFQTETKEGKLTFGNTEDGVYGLISTNIDTADNLLALAKAGKYLLLEGFNAVLNGKYLVHNVDVSSDISVYVGNADDDKVVIKVTPAFSIASGKTWTLDLVNDYIYFQGEGFVTDAAGTGKTVTFSGASLATQAAAGDIITLKSSGVGSFEGDDSQIGVVDVINTANTLTLVDNAEEAIATPTVYYIRKNAANYRIAQLDKFVEDWAPVGATNYANYVTRPLVLSSPADSLKILFDASVPVGTVIKIYYKTWDGADDPATLNYVDSGFATSTSDPEDTFSERSLDITDIAPFKNAVVKIVMKADNPAIVPKVKNLRIVTHS
jgi:hypothetical protein